MFSKGLMQYSSVSVKEARQEKAGRDKNMSHDTVTNEVTGLHSVFTPKHTVSKMSAENILEC